MDWLGLLGTALGACGVIYGVMATRRTEQERNRTEKLKNNYTYNLGLLDRAYKWIEKLENTVDELEKQLDAMQQLQSDNRQLRVENERLRSTVKTLSDTLEKLKLQIEKVKKGS